MRACAVAFVLILCAPLAFAQDFGLLIPQKLVVSTVDNVKYTASAVPWFASPLGEKADLYLSGGFTVEYEGEKWKPLPEVFRFQAIYNPSASLRLEAGRLYFQENLGWLMFGLFDGIAAAMNIKGGWLNAGAFYTGLLYKKDAGILITVQDRINYLDRDKYFASRRFVGGINWEKTSIFDSDINLYASGFFQFDLNDSDFKINSQYLAAKFAVPFGSDFNAEWGAVFELAQVTGNNTYSAFVVSAELQWLQRFWLPGLMVFGGRYASGLWNNTFGAFSPITGEAQGKVLRPMLSGIALVQAAYTLRPVRLFSAELSLAYLFRTDTVTFGSSGLDPESKSPLLGGEFFLNLFWTPFTDLLFTLGGGLFLPSMGKAFANDADVKYRVELTAVISL